MTLQVSFLEGVDRKELTIILDTVYETHFKKNYVIKIYIAVLPAVSRPRGIKVTYVLFHIIVLPLFQISTRCLEPF